MIYYVFQTDAGWCCVAGSDGRIAGLSLPRDDRGAAAEWVAFHPDARAVDSDFSGVGETLQAFFAGEPVEFRCELDYGQAGDFDRSVWDAARDVSYGNVVTYGAIADSIRKPGAARAVGQALGRNPIPVIVPCHRIIRSDGGLGGFSAGLHWKVRMLEMEGSLPRDAR